MTGAGGLQMVEHARKVLLLILALALVPAGAVAEPPKPRDVSEAERAAVELAAAYLHRGPMD
jgi:hypothetical protein